MISIVIPVYNAAKYLPDMLKSIIHQSYKEFEIILVNDGSTDDSSAVCNEYANQYDYITVYDRKNQGASASRNFGAEKASGEFIWFMDSDDILEEDALSQAIVAQKRYNADIVIGGMNFCFEEENKIIPKRIKQDFVLNGSDFKSYYNELFASNYISSLCNKLIRRSIIVENHIKMNEFLCMYEDYVFCMDTLLRCKTVVCLSKVFYNYKIASKKSLSHRYKDNAEEMFYILEKKISEYRKAFGSEFALTDVSLNNLLIYLAYECVKNEAKQKNSYKKVKEILCKEEFHHAIASCKGTGIEYKAVKMIMERKMAFLLLLYFAINNTI